MRLALPLLALLFASPLAAQTLGDTSFDNSGAEAAQPAFLRGLLLLHSFEYQDALEAFQEAQRIDPDFAMAYWGEALTYNHPIWQEQDYDTAHAVLDRLGATEDVRLTKAGTERERDYLRTLHVLYGEGDKEDRDDAYRQAMADLAARYPDDLDAAAFHALSILGTAHEGRDFSTYMAAAAVAEEVFDANPRHPGAAHYLIHAYDDPVHAPLGLRPARAYSEIAPAASHALHMPSHIYVALGQWDEAVDLNVRSFEAARVNSEAHGQPLNGHGWHALYWRHYTELQRGRVEEARRLLDLAREMDTANPSGRTRYHLIAMRANYVIETEDWDGDVAHWSIPMEMASPTTEIRDAFVRGMAAFHRGNHEAARNAYDEITGILGPMDELDRASEAQALMLDAMLRREDEPDKALYLLAQATDMEDAMPLDFGPPNPVKPSHELRGEMLLALGHADEAIGQFEQALARSPRRVRSLEGLAMALLAVGREAEARAIGEEVADIHHAADAVGRHGEQGSY